MTKHPQRTTTAQRTPLSICQITVFAALCMLGSLSLLQRPLRSVATRAMSGQGGYTYQWPRPALTVDTVIVSQATAAAPSKLLLIQRKHPPCEGQWALPGGFVDEGEPLDKAAARELQEETSVQPADVQLFQTGAYGDPGRDPRGWTVTVAYAAVVPNTELGVKAADDAAAAQWFPVEEPPSLAFDHKVVIREAYDKIAALETVRDNAPMVQQLRAGAAALAGPWEKPAK